MQNYFLPNILTDAYSGKVICQINSTYITLVIWRAIWCIYRGSERMWVHDKLTNITSSFSFVNNDLPPNMHGHMIAEYRLIVNLNINWWNFRGTFAKGNTLKDNNFAIWGQHLTIQHMCHKILRTFRTTISFKFNEYR